MDQAQLMSGTDTNISNASQQEQRSGPSAVPVKHSRKVGRPSKRKQVKMSKTQKAERTEKRKATESMYSGSKTSKKKKEENQRKPHAAAGHRPVTSCTHCRQHKIKCNASERFPRPCTRCERMDLKCEIDPEFRPKKGSQIQSLRNDVEELRHKIELLTKNESLIAEALQKANSLPPNHASFQNMINDVSKTPSSEHAGCANVGRLNAPSENVSDMHNLPINYNLNNSSMLSLIHI